MLLFRDSENSSFGAAFVETAIILPIFLCFVFGGIWYARYLNARSSLESAVGTATRLALSRGDELAVGIRAGSVLANLRTEMAGFNLSPTTGSPIDLLLNNNGVNPYGASGFYQTSWRMAFGTLNGGGTPLTAQHVPPSYPLAIGIVHQHMRQSLGDSVRYPCDPREPNNSGCLWCFTLNATSFNNLFAKGRCPAGQFFMEPTGTGTGSCLGLQDHTKPTLGPQPAGVPSYNYQFVGLHCEYRLNSGFLDPLSSLVRVLTGSAGANLMVITATKSFATTKREVDF